jgi:hypothetical protein
MTLISALPYRSHADKQASPAESDAGFILIAAMAMLVTMLGVVLICLYPLTYEARQAPWHREALRRFKVAEQGIFGRLADQPGGVHSAGGGYISDLGSKMIVERLYDENEDDYAVIRLSRAMDFWFYRRYGSISVLNLRANQTEVPSPEGCDDIYRYDPETGFWVGYRGKRYVVRPAGEEHLREREEKTTGIEFHKPRFYTGGSDFFLELAGWSRKDAFFLKMAKQDTTLTNVNRSESDKVIEHTRYFNPVERLVVRVHDRRTARSPLTAFLVYAKQPDPEDADEIADYFPKTASSAVTESPVLTETQDHITRFTFRWDPMNTVSDEVGYIPIVDRGHTFEIGLKKLVLNENGIPVFACGITIPPVREYQCVENDPRPAHHAGCGQTFSDQYVVDVYYDG